MGNLLAPSSSIPHSSQLDPVSSFKTVNEVPSSLTSNTDNNISKLSSKLENPGSIRDLHNKCQCLMPITFEGIEVMLKIGLSNHFQVSHALNLWTKNPSDFRVGAVYTGTKQFSSNEFFPLIVGDIDRSGHLCVNLIHQFSPSIKLEFLSQIQKNRITDAELTTEFRGDDYTTSLTIINPNIVNDSGVIVAHYLQSVTKKLALGMELAYQYGPNIPDGELAVRYKSNTSIWSGTIGTSGVHLCYYLKANEQLQIGVELETCFRLMESVASIGCQIDLPKSDFVFKGMVNSNFCVCGVLEKRLQPLPFYFTLSGHFNIATNQFGLGCGLISV